MHAKVSLPAQEVECRGAGWMGRRGRLTLEIHRIPLPLALVPDRWRLHNVQSWETYSMEDHVVRSVGIASPWILAGEVGTGFTRLL